MRLTNTKDIFMVTKSNSGRGDKLRVWINRYTLLYKTDKQLGPTYSTGTVLNIL